MVKFKYIDAIKTDHHINSIKLNTRDYIFYTQKNVVQLINPQIVSNTTLTYTGHNTPINSIDLYQTQLISCSNNIQIHDILHNDTPIRKYYTDDPFKINQVIFINDSLISSVDDNKTLKIYDLKQHIYKPIQSFQDSKDSINCVCFDDFKISCGSNDGNLYTYDLRMGLLYIDNFQTPITSIKLIDQEVLINCLHQDLIKFNLRNKEIQKFNTLGNKENQNDYKVDNAILVNEHNNIPTKCFVSGSGNGILYGFSSNDYDSIRLKSDVLSCMDYVNDGSFLVVVGGDYGIEMISVDLM